MNHIFEMDSFAVQMIAAGSFVDQPVYDQATYLVETATVRVNRIAMNMWLETIIHDKRESFENAEEWSDYISRKTKARISFKKQLAQVVGFACEDAGRELSVKRIVSEVFTVAWIHKLEPVQT